MLESLSYLRLIRNHKKLTKLSKDCLLLGLPSVSSLMLNADGEHGLVPGETPFPLSMFEAFEDMLNKCGKIEISPFLFLN
jgi:hypothetical protein